MIIWPRCLGLAPQWECSRGSHLIPGWKLKERDQKRWDWVQTSSSRACPDDQKTSHQVPLSGPPPSSMLEIRPLSLDLKAIPDLNHSAFWLCLTGYRLQFSWGFLTSHPTTGWNKVPLTILKPLMPTLKRSCLRQHLRTFAQHRKSKGCCGQRTNSKS